MDAYRGALGVAILPGDRWRRSHDALKDQIYVDGRTLGIDVQKEVYGLFTHYHSAEGRTAYEKLRSANNRARPSACKPP